MDLKIKDVAELLSVSETTIRRWLSEGKIPAYKLQHQYRFNRGEIEDWMLSCRIEQDDIGTSDREPQHPIQKPMGRTQGMLQFSLYRALYKGKVFSDLQGQTKKELIQNAMERFAPHLEVDVQIMVELLLDRENLMSTGLNHGIAVPHTRDFLLKGEEDMILTVFLKEPVFWDSLDQKPVHTLFFLFASNDKRHLHLLSKIAHISSLPKSIDLFLTRPSQHQLLRYVKDWEANLGSHRP